VLLVHVVEEEVDFALGHFCHAFELPLGVPVLFDKKGSDALEELRVVHESLRENILHLESLLQTEVLPPLYLLERDADGHGRHFIDQSQGVLRELGFMGPQALHQVQDCALSFKKLSDEVKVLNLLRLLEVGVSRVLLNDALDLFPARLLVYLLHHLLPHGLKLVAGDEVSGHSPVDEVARLDSLSSQSQVHSKANVVPESRQEVRASNVGEEADSGLRHGIDGVVSCNSDGCVAGDADAAAHDEAIPDCDLEGGHLGELVVHVILLVEEEML